MYYVMIMFVNHDELIIYLQVTFVDNFDFGSFFYNRYLRRLYM